MNERSKETLWELTLWRGQGTPEEKSVTYVAGRDCRERAILFHALSHFERRLSAGVCLRPFGLAC
jgi:hypothetical protein